MSERMNKDRAKEVIKDFTNQIKVIDINDKTPEEIEIEKALDIAIESLEQDQETKEKMWAKQLNECEECEVINNEWVDVRDRLPSENCNVLVTVFNKHFNSYKVEYMWFDKDENIFDYELEYEDFSMYDDEDVIAWKPLPQPYERKE